MEDAQSRIPGLAWPSLFVVFLSLYVYGTMTRDLDTARPDHAKPDEVPPPVTRNGLYSIHARIWEDPLATAFKDYDRNKKDYAAKKLVASQSSSQHPCQKNAPSEAVLEPILQKERDGEHFHTILMPVFVPGGPSAEDKEKRMRMRYAVVSALGEAKYSLKFSSKLTYAVVPNVCVRVVDNQKRKTEFVVPFKLYQNEDGSQVIVLWINESRLGKRPLDVLNQLLVHLAGDFECWDPEYPEQGHRVRVIGPASSDVLLTIANEYCDVNSYIPELQMQFFSPRATITADINNNVRLLENTALNTKGLQFVRVVGDDSQLVKAIKKELEIRGVWNEDDEDDEHNQHPELVLLTEQDTSYGRKIVKQFRDQFKVQSKRNEHSHVEYRHESGNQNPKLRIIKYLRGLDGLTAQDNSGGSAISRLQEGDEYDPTNNPLKNSASNTRHVQLPEGRSQYDYLLRLRDSLIELDKDNISRGGEGIHAIGVVGTDIYDKLLILRALRADFPHATFFTTDLDAHWTHPSEYASTRNLLVASHFGLNLSRDVQAETPPFRDSYQTSTFLAVRIALGHDWYPKCQKDLKNLWGVLDGRQILQPDIYEIGKFSALQFASTQISQSESIKPQKTAGRVWEPRQYLPLCLILGSVVICGLIVARNDAILAILTAILGYLIAIILNAAWIVGAILIFIARCLNKMLCGLGNRVYQVYLHFRKNRTRSKKGTSQSWFVRIDHSFVDKLVEMNQVHERKLKDSKALAAKISVDQRDWWIFASIVIFYDAIGIFVLLQSWISSDPDVEPLGFADGISAWPTILMQSAAFLVSAPFVLWLWFVRPFRKSSNPIHAMESLDNVWRARKSDEGNKGSKVKDSKEMPSELGKTTNDARTAIFSFLIAICVFCFALGLSLLDGNREFIPHTIRGENVRSFACGIHILSEIFVGCFTITFLVEMVQCYKCIGWLKKELKVLPYYSVVKYISDRTNVLFKERIPWVIGLLLLLVVTHHPSLDYAPISHNAVILLSLAIFTMLLLVYLIRRRANDVKRRAIRALQIEKQVLQLIGQDFQAEDFDGDTELDEAYSDIDEGPWSPSVPLVQARTRAKTRMSPGIATKPAIPVVTEAEAELIDNEIKRIEQIDEGVYQPVYSGQLTKWLSGSGVAWITIHWLLQYSQSGM